MSLLSLVSAITAAGTTKPRTMSARKKASVANRRLPRCCEWSAAPIPRGPPLMATKSTPSPRKTKKRTKRSVLICGRNLPAWTAGTRRPRRLPFSFSPSPAGPETLHGRRELAELAQRRGRRASTLRPLAAAGGRRLHAPLGELDHSRGARGRRDERANGLDEDVDRPARRGQPLKAALAEQERLAADRQAVHLIEVRRHDQVDRAELVLEQQEHDPLGRAGPL